MSIVTLIPSASGERERAVAVLKSEELLGCAQAATKSMSSGLGASQPVEVEHRLGPDLHANRLAFLSKPCTAFSGNRLVLSGPLIEVALTARDTVERWDWNAVILFDDATGSVVDLDLEGSKPEFLVRLCEQANRAVMMAPPCNAHGSSLPDAGDKTPRGRGRPKLGVVSREVTLLPRHWEWLAAQPGGASVMLRRLVEQACETDRQQSSVTGKDAAYRFISTIAKDRPNFNEAASALLSGNREMFEQELFSWPVDLRAYALKLATGNAPQMAECKEAAE